MFSYLIVFFDKIYNTFHLLVAIGIIWFNWSYNNTEEGPKLESEFPIIFQTQV